MIKKLLHIEFLKFKKNKLVLFLLGIYAVFSPMIIFSGKQIFQDVGDDAPFAPEAIFEFTSIWVFQGYISSWLVCVLLAFIPIVLITSETRYRTLRQSIINGMTRTQYYQSKILSILVLSLVVALYYWITCFLIGWFNTPRPTIAKALNNNYAFLRFFLSTFGHLIMAMFVAFFIRRSGLALFVFLIYTLLFELGARWLFYFQVFQTKATLFTPMNSIEDLVPNPLMMFANVVKDVFGELKFEVLLTTSQAVISSLIYIDLAIYFSYRVFIKRDI